MREPFPRLSDPAEFRDWAAAGTVRVLYANWVEAADDGRAVLVSETRVAAVDRQGRLGLLAPIQFGGAVALVMIFQVIGLAWLSASYRPEASPDVIRAFNDYCWFAWST